MGKDKGGFLGPKAIANRIKAKGLQKLRWYCQMCQKQCRDENGFKCHLTSESHQRQLLLFAENPDTYIDSFSQEFLDEFLELLRRKCGTKRVSCNIVYQEYIADRNHVHMNSTQWETLTDFVKWTGREGHCVVDQTEKGWFMALIDRAPEAIKKQEALQKKVKMDLDDEEKSFRFIQKQIEKAAAETKEGTSTEFTELQRKDEEEKITLSLGLKKKTEQTSASATKTLSVDNPLKSSKKDASAESTSKAGSSLAGQKRKSTLGEIMKLEEEKKEKKNRKDYWLHKDIIVKVITKELGEKYYKKKAVVREVQNQYVGVIKMLDSGDKLKVDQAHIETVIPALGKGIMVVNGAYRGSQATLMSLDEKHFCCSVEISHGPLKGRVLDNIQYEDISKLHVAS